MVEDLDRASALRARLRNRSSPAGGTLVDPLPVGVFRMQQAIVHGTAWVRRRPIVPHSGASFAGKARWASLEHDAQP
mgnify:FL=1